MSTTHSRAAIYARVSTDAQVKGRTIDSQLEALTQRIRDDGGSTGPDLRFVDEGHSGSTLIRPALERLRDLAALGGFDRLYVHSPDRLARAYVYQMLLVDELRRAGVELVFLNHPIGQSPEDQLLLQMQGMMAEYERAKILERSRRGKFTPLVRVASVPSGRLPMAIATSASRRGMALHAGKFIPTKRPSFRNCFIGWESMAVPSPRSGVDCKAKGFERKRAAPSG